ncbi:MAG: hypothetical protein JWO82_1392 [Akkermansiaceae bacterium]|nr:hypothetical protein [Akkermansiaceae bacterium]
MVNNQPLQGSDGPYPTRYRKFTPQDFERNALRHIGGRDSIVPNALAALSPVPVPRTPEGQCIAYLGRIVQPGRFYNAVADLDGDGVILPGASLSSDELCAETAAKLPSLGSGMLIRPNAVSEVGSGRDQCHCDLDVTHYDFAVMECDHLAIDLQEALLAKFIVDGLDIRACTFSGGKSVHALIWVGATDLADYRAKVRPLFDALVPFGFDPATKNPSRMSRLPGSTRRLSDGTTRLQDLRYLA